MSSAASRVSIVTAKYLYVTTMGALAGLLNVLALALTIKPIMAPLLSKTGAEMNFAVPLSSVPILLLAALLLAGFVGAGMMIFAVFARSFKEGQSMIMPFYMLVLLPPMFVQVPGLQFSVSMAMIPVVNVTMMIRSALAGVFPWLEISITILVSIAMIAAALRFAAFVLQFEEVMSGAANGGMKRFFKDRLFRRKPRLQIQGNHD
jgi:sodium transport system permease protein